MPGISTSGLRLAGPDSIRTSARTFGVPRSGIGRGAADAQVSAISLISSRQKRGFR